MNQYGVLKAVVVFTIRLIETYISFLRAGLAWSVMGGLRQSFTGMSQLTKYHTLLRLVYKTIFKNHLALFLFT